MAPKRYVLDTSALLTLIESEEGANRVEAILREEGVLLPCLTLLEVHYITRQEKGQGEADRRYAFLKHLSCEILWELDEPTLLTAARFKAGHKVSLANSVIAAMAHRHQATLVHKDPEFEALQEELDLEALPYKGR